MYKYIYYVCASLINIKIMEYEKLKEMKTYEKSIDMFSKKPFHKESAKKVFLATFTQVLLQICGMCLASVSLYLLANAMIPSFEYKSVVIFIAVLVVLATLEVAKYIIWKDLFLIRYKTDRIDIATLMISLFLFLVSASSSSIGAYQIATSITDSTSQIEKRKDRIIAKVERDADAKIKDLKSISAEIERQNTEKIRGGMILVIPEVEQVKIQNYQKLIQAYENEKAKKISDIENREDSGIKVVKDISLRYAIVAFCISLVFELIAFLCSHYTVYFNYRVYLEGLSIVQKKPEPEPTIPQTEQYKPEMYKPEPTPIGFVASKAEKTKNNYGIIDKESAQKWMDSNGNGLQSSTRKEVLKLINDGVMTNKIVEKTGVSRKTIMIAKWANEFL